MMMMMMMMENNIFEIFFTTLTKNFENLKKCLRCNFYLLLGQIFNICRIVALDLKKEVLISIYNKKLYIIMYNKNLYMSLKLEDNNNNSDTAAATATATDRFDDDDYNSDDDDDVFDDNNGISKSLNIHCFVKRFINYSNKFDVLNRVKAIEEKEEEENQQEILPSTPSLSSSSSSSSSSLLSSFAIFNRLFGGYFSTSTPPPHPPLQQQQQQQEAHKDIITNWDNWGPTPKDFFTWEYVEYNHNDIYVRKNIHYKKSLRDIFIYNNNIGNDAIITNKDTSIQKFKKCILYYNHLLSSKNNYNSWLLNYHNVICIDFGHGIFTTRNVKENKKSKKITTNFQTFLIYCPLNDDDEQPWVDYEIFVDDDYINYMDYISLIITTGS